jgi:hypothetical protein
MFLLASGSSVGHRLAIASTETIPITYKFLRGFKGVLSAC